MLTRFITAATAIVVATCLSTGALAHAHLVGANPTPGSVLKASPTSIRMTFSEALLPRFSGVALSDGKGAAVPTGQAKFDGQNTKLTVPLQAQLKPGIYKVAWHAVSADTHRVSGKFTFKVGR